MYVIKRRDGFEFFYGFDRHYDPPKLLTSRFKKRLTFYRSVEEMLPIMQRIGPGWEIVQLKVVRPEYDRR